MKKTKKVKVRFDGGWRWKIGMVWSLPYRTRELAVAAAREAEAAQ